MFATRWRPRGDSPARLFLAACFALAMLAVGGAAHIRHHLEEPHCDSGPGPESHACASCASLHGGAIAEAALGDLPARAFWSPVLHPATPAPRARHSAGAAAPRAPPLA